MESDNNTSLDSFKGFESSKAEAKTKAKPTFKVRINRNRNQLPATTIKEINDKIDALQRAVSRLTYQVAKAIELQQQRNYSAAGWARERRWL